MGQDSWDGSRFLFSCLDYDYLSISFVFGWLCNVFFFCQFEGVLCDVVYGIGIDKRVKI